MALKTERRLTGLGRLKQAGMCALAHIITRTDATKHIFPILDCQGCEDRMFCRKIARLIEKELNL